MKKTWMFILLLVSFPGKTNDLKSPKDSGQNKKEDTVKKEDTYDKKDHEAVQSQLKNFQETLKKIQKDQGIQDSEASELKKYEEILNPKEAIQRPSSPDDNADGQKKLKETQSQLIKYQKVLMKIHQKNNTPAQKDNIHKKPTQSQLEKYRKMLKGQKKLPLQNENNAYKDVQFQLKKNQEILKNIHKKKGIQQNIPESSSHEKNNVYDSKAQESIQSQLEQYQEMLKNIQKKQEIQQKNPLLKSSSHEKDDSYDSKAQESIQSQREQYKDDIYDSNDQLKSVLSDESSKSIESLDEKQNLQQKLQSFKDHALGVEQDEKKKNVFKRWWNFFFGKRKEDEPKASDMVASMLMLFQGIPKDRMEILIIERTDGTVLGRILNRYPKIIPFAVLLIQDKTAIPSLAGILDNREKLGIFIICNLIVLFYSVRWSFKNRKSKYPLLIRIKRRLTATVIFWSCRLGLIFIFFKTQLYPFIDLLRKYNSS